VNAHAGNLSHGIYGLFAFDSVIEHMEITTDGKDSHAVYLRWADDPRHTGTATIRDSVLTSHTSSTFNRHSGPANVFVGGRLIAERNILIGGNSGFNTGNQSVINNNIIGHSGFATNGYGVFAYDTHNVTITNNLILPTNGRGIIFDGGHDNTASGNIILHLEAPNSEFGDALNPPAIRMRYGAHDHTYSNNISLGIGGSGYTSASSIYLTTYGHGVNTFENNDATTILVGAPDRNHYAQPVTLEGQGTITNSVGPGLDVIANNNFQSNHHMVALSGFDGGAQQREPLANNSWEWTTGESAHTNFLATVHTRLANLGLTATVTAAAESHVSSIDALVNGLIAQQDLQSSRAFWRLNHWTGGVPIFGDLLDSTFGVGVDPRSHDGDPINGSRVLARSGFTRNVQFLDGVAPIANAAVTVTTAEGDSYQTTTDANGFATLRFYDFGIEKVSGGSNNPYTTIDRSQSTITAEGNSIIVDHNSVPNQINFGTVPAALAVPDDQGAIAWIQSNWNQTNTTLTSVSSAASESLYLSYARYASGDTDPNLTHSLAFAQMPLSKPQEISSAILRKEELDEPDKEIRKVDAVFDLLQEIDAIQLTIRRIVW
jgi:parallel beta-helix repeat protein